MMEYGHFDDAAREFVITDPETPWPWINYLGTENFFSLISGTAGGYSFYRDARFRRLTRYRYNGVPTDAGGRYFYINDGGCVWSPGWKPCRNPLDFYECRHGMGYTRIVGEKNGLRVSELFFVPPGYDCEIQKVTLENCGGVQKTFKFWSFAEWCLWNAGTDMENFQRNLSTGEVEVEGSVIYHKTEYRERRNHYAFYGVNTRIDGFDTDRDAFIGMYNGFDSPRNVVAGVSTQSIAHGWSPVASHYLELTLGPGESRDLVFVLGYAENPSREKFVRPTGYERNSGSGVINKNVARKVMAAFDTVEKADEAFAALRRYWDGILGNFSLISGVPELDRMVNVWNQYQCMVTFLMSRSASFFESGIGRGMGFRDSNQDLLGIVHQIPGRARQRILDIAATQFPDGGCYHQYQPLTKRGNDGIGAGFNDDPLWLLVGVDAYLRETGDFAILDEPVPFDNVPGSDSPLLEHLTVSFEYVRGHFGPHGLPLIGRADWNDCLNLNCFSADPDESFQTTENRTEGSKAESMMIAGLFVFAGHRYAEILDRIGRDSKSVREAVGQMSEAIKEYGWDGEWFLRAYDFFGRKVGSKDCEEGRIFIESQGWCSMARAGAEEGLCDKALDSVKRYLDTPDGIVLCNPPFSRYYPEYGEISSYPEGYKENAGIFCHNNPWIVIGEAMAGRADDAWEHYSKISPAFIKNQELHKVEPYVYCQMLAGKDSARPGEGKNSWLTGTAAWNWNAVSEYLLGVKPRFDGLLIEPCLPSFIKEYRIRRVFRDSVYDITVRNSGERQSRFIPYSPGHHELTLDL